MDDVSLLLRNSQEILFLKNFLFFVLPTTNGRSLRGTRTEQRCLSSGMNLSYQAVSSTESLKQKNTFSSLILIEHNKNLIVLFYFLKHSKIFSESKKQLKLFNLALQHLVCFPNSSFIHRPKFLYFPLHACSFEYVMCIYTAFCCSCQQCFSLLLTCPNQTYLSRSCSINTHKKVFFSLH